MQLRLGENMSKYELGRDLQELRSRLDRLEQDCGHYHEKPDQSPWRPEHPGLYGKPAGSVVHSPEMGIDIEKKPVLWKADKAFKMPPLFAGLLGYGPQLMFDAVQSKTWSCTPEPLILYVNWTAGGTDELYRLVNQVFSVYRVMDPNTGVSTGSVVYSAQLIASGRGKFHYYNVPPPYFNGTLRNAGGAALGFFGGYIDFNCQDNKPFNVFGKFAPGLYDIINGGTWYMTGGNVDRC
jgi:hypothetical protein